MALSNYVLKEMDLKNSYSEILVEVYYMKDYHKIRKFCNSHGYKLAFCFHKAESEDKKAHIHCYIKSDSKHRFNVNSLISDTLKAYNFMKSKTRMLEFINYVMHNDYDFKEKYSFSEVHFLNVSNAMLKEYALSLSGYHEEIEDTDRYNPQTFEKLMFKGQFHNWNEIVEFCSHTEQLRRYFMFHSQQIRTAFYIAFNGNKMLTENQTYEYMYDTHCKMENRPFSNEEDY